MGRWTPLILMAGGLAILLGTLLGISFPMGGQNTAQVPTNVGSKTSKVLPANINVNSTASGNASTTTTNRSNVAQNSNPNTTNDSTTPENNQDTSTPERNDANQNSKTVQALW